MVILSEGYDYFRTSRDAWNHITTYFIQILIIIALTRNSSYMNFNGRAVLVSKKVNFEGFFAWPLIFYRQKLCKTIFASLKNLFSVICGFRIPDSGSGFRFRILDFGFRFPGFRVALSDTYLIIAYQSLLRLFI